MKKYIDITLYIAMMLAALSYHNVNAASRTCTADEKAEGDQLLHNIVKDEERKNSIAKNHMPLGIHINHETGDNEHILYQGGYILKHDHDLRTSLWVSYKLTKQDITNAAGKQRVNCFRTDPRLNDIHAATRSDYNEPIFDQGHLANDADLKDDLLQQVNSYIMSNMSPQQCRFNRGIWLSLEHLTRKWAKQYTTIFVTSGAIFDNDGNAQRDTDEDSLRMVSRNGKQRVAVPSHYYKVIVRKQDDMWKSISFLLKHTNDSHGVKWEEVRPDVIYSITNIGIIEELAEITLHPGLDRKLLNQQIADWDLSTAKSNLESTCK